MRLPAKFLRKFKSLKYRLFVLQFLGVIIPLSLLGYASYSAIYGMLKNNIDEGIQNTLLQVRKDLEDMLSSLEYASLELSFEGSIGQKMSEYFRSEDLVEKRRVAGEIEQNVTLVNYTNKSLGVMAYYFPNKAQFMFQNLEVMNDYDPFANKVFMKSKDALFFGPHRSAYRYGKHTVFSVVKKLPLPTVAGDEQLAYVYIESNFNKLQTTLSVNRYGMTSVHMLADADGEVVYNGSDIAITNVGDGLKKAAGYHFFHSISEQGWQVIAGVKEEEYRGEIVKWFRSLSMIVVVSVLLAFLFFWILWRTIYRPMKEIVKAIGAMEATKFDKSIPRSNVLEFDFILSKFGGMRSRITSLLSEVEHKERLRGKLEVEKVLHQISPHFLYNSLNTIQWLAKMQGNDEINRLVIVLTRVLRYNLGKEGSFVTVEEELNALRDYIELQSIRYDYQFDIEYRIDEEALQNMIPRFIVQPLLENALYHGMDDEHGKITLEIGRMPGVQRLQIVVADNGAGMSPSELAALQRQNIRDEHRSGLGIGLNYVVQMLQSCYGDEGSFHIESYPELGTKVSIWIPLGRKAS